MGETETRGELFDIVWDSIQIKNILHRAVALNITSYVVG